MAASFLGHAELKPHGDNLLTSSAEFWLNSARVLVFLMAGSEAIAWGYLGYLFGDGVVRWIGAAITGGVIFLVVWMIDASLITMDRAWREHSAALLGQTFTDNDRRAVRTFFTFVVRIGLLVGSLYITAPYLAQVVFHKDIQEAIDRTVVTNLGAARNALAARYDERLQILTREREDATRALEREAAGKGLSGVKGLGPAVKTMTANLAAKTTEIEGVVSERNAALDAFNKLAADWRSNRDALAATYNVELPRTSILSNRLALEELRQRPEHQATEVAIKAFLGFIFTGLFLLKLFEPNSIRLYMSEVLQQEYLRYRAGTFDDRLPPTERSDVEPSPMTPQRLYQFLLNVWAPRMRSEYQEAESQARELAVQRELEQRERAAQRDLEQRERAVQRDLEQMEHLREQILSDLKSAADQHQEVLAKVDDARKRTVQLQAAIEIVRGDIEAYTKQLEKWARDEGRSQQLDEDARFERATLKSRVRQKLVEANRKLEELREQQPTEKDRLDRVESELVRCESRLRTQEVELTKITDQIMELRRGPRLLEAPARAALPASTQLDRPRQIG
jgi:hypothetical protein